MKKVSVGLLRTVLILIGVFVLVIMLWEPNVEGRNTNSTLFQVYFNDPFLTYVYLGSLAFFTGLYQTFKMLGYIGNNQFFFSSFCKHSLKDPALQYDTYHFYTWG